MRALDLHEKRSNPVLNTGGKIGTTFADLARHYDDDTYVSLTALPKLGFNPQSTYSTPLGVYAYPLKDEVIQNQLEQEMLPFAGKQPFINLIRAQTDVVDLAWNWKYFAHLSDAIDNYLFDHLKINLPPEANSDKDCRAAIAKTREYAEDSATKKSAGGMWWNHGRVASLLLTRQREPSYLFISELEDIVRNQTFIKGSHAMWTKIMLAIGVKAVLDHGQGIIHGNERTQAVFFSPDAFKLLTRVANPHNIERRQITITTAYDLGQLLARANYSINCRVLSKLFTNAIMGWPFNDAVGYRHRDGSVSELMVRVKIGGVPDADILQWPRVLTKLLPRLTHFQFDRFSRLLMAGFPDEPNHPRGRIYKQVMQAMIPPETLVELKERAMKEFVDSY